MKLGVIGVGNMGSAIIKGYIASGANPRDIMLCGHHKDVLKKFKAEYGTLTAQDSMILAEACDVIIIAVKPKDAGDVMAEIAPIVSDGKKLVISVVAGITIKRLVEALGDGAYGSSLIVRAMPNMPAAVGEGMTAISRGEGVSDEHMKIALEIFGAAGRASEIPETLMDAVTGLSGSGPAFAYIFMEALADGAVMSGMPRAKAVEFAAQTVLGAARMVLESGKSPGELKDEVCSPAGTTITGVRALEDRAFRSAAMEAVIAASEKSAGM